MSSIRVFVLGALARTGPMHGYQLRMFAEQSHVQNWTDITPGALYGALGRLRRDGLIEEVRSERDGTRPERQIVAITDAGRAELERLEVEIWQTFHPAPDPFDLALAWPSPAVEQGLAAFLEERHALVATTASDFADRMRHLHEDLTDLEQLVMSHRNERLRAEVAFIEQALATIRTRRKKAQNRP